MRPPGWMIVALVVTATGSAYANPRRKGTVATVTGGGGTLRAGGDTGPAMLISVRFGVVFGEDAKFAGLAELNGGQAWTDAGRRPHGALLASVATWPTDRVSLSLGLGVTVEDNGIDDSGVAGGPAVGGSFGVDLVQRRRSAIVLRASLQAGEDDDGARVAAMLNVGVDFFELGGP